MAESRRISNEDSMLNAMSIVSFDRTKRKRYLAVAIIIGLGIAISAALTSVWPASGWASWMPDWFPVPKEDAYILYRYSENLSNGHGIVWNVGDAPTDGATDFLWMLVLATWAAVFGQVIPGNYILGGMFMVGASLVAVWGVTALGGDVRRARLLIPVVFISPMLYHVVNGYGVPLLSLLLGVNIVLFLVLSDTGRAGRGRYYSAWALIMLLTGVARPDANAFNLFLILGHVFILQRARVMPYHFISKTFVLYVLPGTSLLLFRYFYFGELLPAPAIVKIGAQPLSDLLAFNIDKYAVRTLVPIVIFSLPLLFISRRHWRLPYRLAFVSVLAYFAIYLFFTQSQNDSFRFEYPMVYLAALLSILAISTERMYGRYKRLSYVAPVVAGIVAFLIFTPASYQIADSRWPVASIMNDYEHQEYVLATTEAGVLPFVSKWKVLDTYGLNDYEIARNGITDSYWDSFDPDVVVNHAGFGWPSEANPGNRFQLYEQMSRSGSYVAVAAIEIRRPFGRSRPFDYHIIFVKSDLFNFDDLVYRITNIDGETYVDIPDDFTKRFTSVSPN